MPLRWCEGDSDRAASAVIDSGWFEGPYECARILLAMAPLKPVDGLGFGSRWPLLRDSHRLIAPALPVVASDESGVAIDAEYRCDTKSVWREAVGVEEIFLTGDESIDAPGRPFDLLWFGDSERFTVRGEVLEIEDLFGKLCVPATGNTLDRGLIRARRIDSEVLSSLQLAETERPQTIEVRRPARLNAKELWRDPARFMAGRSDIEKARVRGGCVEARVVGGAVAVFQIDESDSGWSLVLRDGNYVFGDFCVQRQATTLSVCATLDDRLDGMAPGMRGRLIFDLRADLVALG